jgi:hypothetical protein
MDTCREAAERNRALRHDSGNDESPERAYAHNHSLSGEQIQPPRPVKAHVKAPSLAPSA